MRFFRFGKIILIGINFLIVNNISIAQEAEQHYQSCLIYAEKGAFQQALHTISKAIALDSSRFEYFLKRAEIHYNLGSYDYTIKDCYTVLRLKPDVPEVYLLRGKVCVVTESYGPAILFFGKTLKYAEAERLRFDAYLNRGNAFLNLQRYEDALSDFKNAYALNTSSPDVMLHLSETYLHLDKPNEAIQILNKTLIQKPDCARAYELLGRIALDSKEFPKAISAYEKYAALKPDEVEPHNVLAELYLEIDEYDKALNTLCNSLAIDPLEPNAYKLRGLIYIAQGDTEKGCNTLFRAMQLGYFEKYGYDLLDIYREKCEE